MQKKQHLIQLATGFAIVILAAYISSYAFFRFDLTAEKRFTLSKVSKQLIRKNDQVVYIKVYLDGDMPIGFKRMQTAIRDLIDEFRVYGGNNIQYQFIDPFEQTDPKKRQALIEELSSKGLQPINVEMRSDKGEKSQKLLIPGALVVCNNMEVPVNFLVNNAGYSAEENLNQSIQSIEYLLISQLRNVTTREVQKIAFLEGHGELDQMETGDITRHLSNFYQVDRGSLSGRVNELKGYKVVIVARPSKPFTPEDKYVLDQYLMNGGNILWFIDGTQIESDSLASGMTLGFPQQLYIDDQLFKYGIRINADLVQDIQCALLPINTAAVGQQARFSPLPWYYYPLLLPAANHPITRNLNLVYSQFVSSIDTILEPVGVKKTVLLSSSQFARTLNAPLTVSLDEIKKQATRNEFNKSDVPTAVMIEGAFPSAFRNRMLTALKVDSIQLYRDSAQFARVAVVADGDVIRNQVRQSPNGPMISPLGYDRYSRQTFGNRDFVLNLVNYMTDSDGIMSLRNREIKLRLLDKAKLADQGTFWKWVNTVVPILLVFGFGTLIMYVRKKKYAR